MHPRYIRLRMEATAHPERIPSHHPHAFADHSRQFTFSSLGNVIYREWSANVRKYLYGGGGALGEQASCLLCLLIHRCQTDFKQISVLHLSDICGQTGCLLCLLIHRCQTDFKQISVLHLSNICGQTGCLLSRSLAYIPPENRFLRANLLHLHAEKHAKGHGAYSPKVCSWA